MAFFDGLFCRMRSDSFSDAHADAENSPPPPTLHVQSLPATASGRELWLRQLDGQDLRLPVWDDIEANATDLARFQETGGTTVTQLPRHLRLSFLPHEHECRLNMADFGEKRWHAMQLATKQASMRQEAAEAVLRSGTPGHSHLQHLSQQCLPVALPPPPPSPSLGSVVPPVALQPAAATAPAWGLALYQELFAPAAVSASSHAVTPPPFAWQVPTTGPPGPRRSASSSQRGRPGGHEVPAAAELARGTSSQSLQPRESFCTPRGLHHHNAMSMSALPPAQAPAVTALREAPRRSTRHRTPRPVLAEVLPPPPPAQVSPSMAQEPREKPPEQVASEVARALSFVPPTTTSMRAAEGAPEDQWLPAWPRQPHLSGGGRGGAVVTPRRSTKRPEREQNRASLDEGRRSVEAGRPKLRMGPPRSMGPRRSGSATRAGFPADVS